MQGHWVSIVVSDDAARQSLAELMQMDGGCEVMEFVTGDGFLGSLNGHIAGVIVIDLDAPDVDGLSILEALRARQVAGHAIGLADASSIGTAVQAMKLGAYDVVSKPCDPKRLREAVEECCRLAPSGGGFVESHGGYDLLTVNWKRVGRELQLSRRQLQIAECICRSMANDGIGYELGISSNTVKMHIKSLYQKLGVQDRVGVAIRCVSVDRLCDDRGNGQNRDES